MNSAKMAKKAGAVALIALFTGALFTGSAQAERSPDGLPPVDQSTQQKNREAALSSTQRSLAAYQEEFINAAGPAAQAVQAEFRVPASVATGQAILESNWGRSTLSVNDKNYFGFKCTSPGAPGPIAIGCHKYSTTECTPTCHTVDAYFRVYASMRDSFRDYGRLLNSNPVYAPAFQHLNDPDEFIRKIGAHYATDPQYANKVISLMRNWNLYRFNTPIAAGSSLSGDGKADFITVLPSGEVKAWRNGAGFAAMPWDADAIVGTGFAEDNVKFADLDGDGDKELITVLPSGEVKAWRNGAGFAAMPWDADAIIATGFTKDNVQFADLDGDRKAEIIQVLPSGEVKAWHNGAGFAAMPWNADAIIATGFTKDNVQFADLDGDGKAELTTVLPGGEVKAWHNGAGFAAMPWNADAIIATGFTKDNVQFGDLDGDGKAELTTVLPGGEVKAWHNGAGFAAMPWNADAIIATGFTSRNYKLA
ncbi:glucosaminidase domain-containing protein [Nonomuraea typhae]|uniref:glucosaminidase domain-containing protein n=1 Tax=Nonomuraea typhae TaxID=2603600 RepID=UPI001CA5E071|nr:glucosaminidase domain-containing protein [Nonomuraea typhae]